MATPSYPFTWNETGLRAPAKARRVESLAQGSQLVGVSDLIPMAAVTDTWPVIGQTTYGNCNFMNVPVDAEGNTHFGDYVLQKIEYGWREPDFARLYFTPVLTLTGAISTLVPFKTEWTSKVHQWHPILEKILFTDDEYLKVPIQTANGTLYKPRVYVTWEYRSGVTDACKVRQDYYLSDRPFDLSSFTFTVPQPTDVSWELGPLGQSGSMGSCLHPKVRVRAPDPRTAFAGSVYHEEYPATNVATWQAYVFDFEASSINGVAYQGILRTVYPPPLTSITRKKA